MKNVLYKIIDTKDWIEKENWRIKLEDEFMSLARDGWRVVCSIPNTTCLLLIYENK